MAAITEYLTREQLKSALKIPDTNTSSDLLLDRAISAASEQIDDYCNDQFWLSDLTAREFTAEYPDKLFTGSFAERDTTVIEFDMDGDGTFETTLNAANWQPDPISRKPGRPYREITLLNGDWFPGAWRSPYYGYTWRSFTYSYGGWPNYPRDRRALVRVTAKWGWPQVPDRVVQACEILAIANFKSKDLTGGVSGSTSMATGSFGAKRDIMLFPAKLDPQAIALIEGLRNLAVG